MADKATYDTSIGSGERSVRSATKLWTIVFAVIFIIGLALIIAFYSSVGGTRNAPGGAARPAETGNVGP